MQYAQVLLFKNIKGFANGLTYLVPEQMEIAVGSLVTVPFRSQNLVGLVVDCLTNPPKGIDSSKLRAVQSVLENSCMSENHLSLAKWISSYYKANYTKSFRQFFPKRFWDGKFKEPTAISYRLIDSETMLRGDRQKEVIEIVEKYSGFISSADLSAELPHVTSSTLKGLVKKDVLEIAEDQLYEKFDHKKFTYPKLDKVLTESQVEAIKQIQDSSKPILLHGVTGSGKTEVYLRMILETVNAGAQAMLLVPEIALTPQTISYFQKYLGNHIALFHSGLSDGERLAEWWKVKTGFAPLAIGSRSAIFAPAENLGLIILDEEHEWTYKQESAPYYQTHQVAEKMSKLFSAKVLFGTATPSAESYYKAKDEVYSYVDLPNRIHQGALPKIEVVDLREEFKKRNFSVFSLALQNKISDRLLKGEQIILFVNQRGLASAVVCRDCGYTEQCPSCEISLKFHRSYQQDRLMCHYCTYTKSPTLVCPECKSPHIKYMGVGTQRVEEEMRRLYPEAKVVRADRDTTQNKAGFKPIYEKFLAGDYDVLIGTQMIAKGLDFSNVSLIGIVLADIGLHLPDFRSSERLFQITTQVAGRCGRGKAEGEVILQTYNPDHPTIQRVANYEYQEFIEEELKHRSKLGYPPFNRMVKFTVVGMDQAKLRDHIHDEQEAMEDIFKSNKLPVKILSAPALIPKMSNRYYYHVLLRSEKPEIVFDYWSPPAGWRVDIDPIHTT